MVRRVLDLVYKEVRGLHQAAYILAAFTFASQMLALVRDRLLAHQFGAGEVLDLYYTAFRIPDILFVLFASTLSVYVLIPFVSRTQMQGSEATEKLLGSVATLFIVTYIIVAALAALLAPLYVHYVFPGINNTDTLVLLIRILLLQPFFLGISNLFGVVTQLSHRFMLYALSPLLYNIGIIVGIMFFYPIWGVAGLALGVVLGAVAHALVQWPLVRQGKMKIVFLKHFSWPILKPILVLSVPRALTLSANQVVLIALIGMAGLLTAGSVAVYQFAYNLQSVPLAIIGVSYSVAAFPILAQLYADKEHERFAEYIMTALRHIVFWTVPVIVLCVVLRAQLVRVILGSGSFNWEDTRLTAAIFAILVLSIAASGIQLLLVRAFYAAGNTFTPLVVSLGGAVLSILALYVTFEWYNSTLPAAEWLSQILRVRDVAGTEIVALAIVYASMIIIQTKVLFFLAVRAFSLPLHLLVIQIRNAVVASAIGGVAAYVSLQFFVSGLNTETFIGIFLQGALAGLLGVIGVVLGYWFMRSSELAEIHNSLNKRLFKVSITAVPQEDVI